MIDSKILGQVLIKISQSKNGEQSVDRFFEFLKKKNFIGFLPQIKRYLEKKKKEISQSEILVISSKYELTNEEKKEIISLVGADEKTEIKFVKDEDIIGGFSATYKGNIYDGSLKNQIRQLKVKLSS